MEWTLKTELFEKLQSTCHRTGASENHQGQVRQSSIDSTNLANTNMVSAIITSDQSTIIHPAEKQSLSTTGSEMNSSSFKPPSGSFYLVRENLENKGLSTLTADIILQSWRQSTGKQYGTYFKRWMCFSNKKQTDPLDPSINTVLSFLSSLYDSGLSYSAINTAKSAISSICSVTSGIDIGKHKLVTRYMRGIFNARPSLPKYTETWDVNIVLDYLKTLPANEELTLLQLSQKLALLLMLLSAQRCQTVHLIKLNNITISNDNMKVYIVDLVKQSKPGKHIGPLEFNRHDDCKLCVIIAMEEYLKRTSKLRGQEKSLFISCVKPFKTVTKSTISRWIKQLLGKAGIDIKVYGTHSCRSASSSSAAAHGIPLNNILKTAACPESAENLPVLPNSVNCTISEGCTAVECCVESVRLQRYFHTVLTIDPCHYNMTVGIDRYTFNVNIQDKPWETIWNVWLNGVVRLDLNVYDVYNEKQFLVNMNVSICFEDGGPCDLDNIIVLENSLLNKGQCDFNTQFPVKDFSISTFADDKGLTHVSPYPDYFVAQVLDTLMVSPFMNELSCDRDASPWTPPGHDGWKRECAAVENYYNLYDTGSIDLLREGNCNGTICNITETVTSSTTETNCISISDCTGFRCCVEDTRLTRSFVFGIYIDACNFTLTLVIEELEYVIYLADLSFDFSLIAWSAENELPLPLPNYGIVQLLKETNMATYMKDVQCDRSGFTNCTLTTSNLPVLDSNTSCRLLSQCTSATCCLTVGTINRTVSIDLELDPCDQSMSIRIENYVHNTSLYGFGFGILQKFYLENILRVEYVVYDLESDHQYLVDMNVSVCFEFAGPCELTSTMFHKTFLPKMPCQWQTGFIQTDFSLAAWRIENDIGPTALLYPVDIARLIKELGLGDYLMDSPCSRLNGSYVPHSSRWNDSKFNIDNLYEDRKYLVNVNLTLTFEAGGPETSHHVIFKNTLFPKQSCDWSSDFHISNCAMNMTLPPLSSDVSCHVTSLCTGIQCCVDNELLNRTLDFSILLDPCEKRLSISIEQTRYNTTFSNINWGVNQYFNLQGMIRIEYNIDDLYSERYFLVNARVLFCYEASQACSVAYTVLNNTMLPKVTCSWNDGFLQSGFSLSNWYTEHDQTTGDKLDDWAISVFLDDLGLSPFLDTSACNVDPSFVYVNNDSWTNECIKSVNLPSITTTTDRTRCLMRTSCTAVDCCTDVDFIPKSFKTYLHIDPCRQELVVGIEKYMRNISLSTYKWGTLAQFKLNGFIVMDYFIEELAGSLTYLVSLNISFCYNDGQPCNIIASVLENTLLPRDLCAWNTDYLIPGFSLNTWLTDNFPTVGHPLPEYAVELLFEQLGISQYRPSTQCSETALYMAIPPGEWLNACPLSTNIPDLDPSYTGIACHVTDMCTGVDCCVTSTVLDRSFNVKVELAPCDYILTIGIDDFVYSLSLEEFRMGEQQQFSLGGVVNIMFSVYDLAASNYYLMSMNITICTESMAPCEQTFVVLDNVLLPKRQCTWNATFVNPTFSLTKWMIKNGVTAPLPDFAIAILLDDLAVSPCLLSSSCDRGRSPYNKEVTDGWRNVCHDDLNVTLTPVAEDDHVTCVFNCYTSTCCYEVDGIGRSIMSSVSINTCKSEMRLTIERITQTVSLQDYNFGSAARFSLFGVFRIDYTIYDLESEHNYLILTLSTCFEYSGTCMFTTTIFNGFKLPKEICTSGTTRLDTAFDFDTWLASKDLPSTTIPLPEWAATQLVEELGVAKYVSTTECYDLKSPFIEADAVNGWKTIVSMLPTPTSLILVPPDLCVVYQYTIREVDFEDQYEVNMTLTVCFDSTTCEIEHPVFINTILIKEVCNWTSEFKTPDFSMSEWLSDRNLTMTSDLNDINADELLQDLGLTDFMGSTSLCDHGISPFNTLTNGWNNECTTPGIVLSSISHPAACHANSDCNRFSCCIEVDILKRSLFAAVYLNPCRYNLQVQLEQLTIDVDLFTYTWGERKQYFLYGVFRLEFMINHVATERAYVVDVNIKVCFEAGSGSSCYQEFTVLEDTRIQYPNCSTSGLESLPFDGLSLDFWEPEVCYFFNGTVFPRIFYIETTTVDIFTTEEMTTTAQTTTPEITTTPLVTTTTITTVATTIIDGTNVTEEILLMQILHTRQRLLKQQPWRKQLLLQQLKQQPPS
ncbi:unnamed protein product [Mytilus edulis]|uniref:Core-binding (CB) domain-containing protein n=1 Tax=Mytilus edulis TaxID=6550 RepID=A0A8S3Q183_MYTED|nr:unnamed protein product [Mytilus edulis]